MVSSDDDRDRGLKFGFRAQQRMRERERREKSKDERKKREREADEEREMMKDVAKRIAEGDLRARVLAKVAEQLKTDEVQARLTEQVDTARAAMRKVRGGVGCDRLRQAASLGWWDSQAAACAVAGEALCSRGGGQRGGSRCEAQGGGASLRGREHRRHPR